jgi:hypothetical protein
LSRLRTLEVYFEDLLNTLGFSTFDFLQQENLTYSLVNAYYIAALTYNAHGRTLEAGYFAEKAKKDGLTYFGPTWKYLDDAQILIDFPQKHDSYFNMRFDD